MRVTHPLARAEFWIRAALTARRHRKPSQRALESAALAQAKLALLRRSACRVRKGWPQPRTVTR